MKARIQHIIIRTPYVNKGLTYILQSVRTVT